MPVSRLDGDIDERDAATFDSLDRWRKARTVAHPAEAGPPALGVATAGH